MTAIYVYVKLIIASKFKTILLYKFGSSIEWKVFKYGPEISPYLDTFHAVKAFGFERVWLSKRLTLSTVPKQFFWKLYEI